MDEAKKDEVEQNNMWSRRLPWCLLASFSTASQVVTAVWQCLTLQRSEALANDRCQNSGVASLSLQLQVPQLLITSDAQTVQGPLNIPKRP